MTSEVWFSWLKKNHVQALLFPELTDAGPTCKWDAIFVIARKYNGFNVSSLIYTKSRRSIHRKPTTTRCPCLYYANSNASCQILSSAWRNQQSVTCSICFGLRHTKCAKLKSVISNWTCGSGSCPTSVLPFYSSSIEDEFNDPADVYESNFKTYNKYSTPIIYFLSCFIVSYQVRQ